MRTLLILSLMVGLNVNAAGLKTEADDVKPVFLDADTGKQLSAIEATQASIGGKRVLKCGEVEAKASAKGNISLKKKSN